MTWKSSSYAPLRPAFPESQSAQFGDPVRLDILARDQYMKILTHTRRSDEMFQLQSNLGSLLRQAAFFECIGELTLLPDSHQELRLGQQGLSLHSILLGRG